MTAINPEELRTRFAAAGQEHIFAHWNNLEEAQRQRLVAQAADVDLDLVAHLASLLTSAADDDAAGTNGGVQLEPPDIFPLERTPLQERAAAEAIALGERVLSEGMVAYVLVAGGQGSRLGFNGPKGKFPVGPVSAASLFGWHAQRLAAARDRYGAPVVWYIMTSAANDADTRSYFSEHDNFGLGSDAVHFFQQDMLPALDMQGRILMSERDALFLAPNGHGGTLSGLANAGLLEDAEQREIEVLSYFQVDNPLVRPADPLFIGLHVIECAQMSCKVVAKRDAGEKVGVIGRSDGVLGCIEYSDLPAQLRDARDESGQLVFGAGNIAVHVFERRFIQDLTAGGLQLPWHLARKQMEVVDASGARGSVAGVKFETFVFDALAKAKGSVTLEVERALEFSPVKNAQGEDSPASTRRDLTTMFAGWIRSANCEVPAAGKDGCSPVEVAPGFAEDEASFLARMPAEPRAGSAGVEYR